MVARYENAQDANQQIGGCIVMYDEKPVHISECFTNGEDIICNMQFMPRARENVVVSLFDPKFDVKSMGRRLGYMNTFRDLGAGFITRIPTRQYKQGLHANNIAFPRNFRGVFDFRQLRNNPQFCDMLLGKYPTFEEARVRLIEEPTIKSIAFNRYFAIERDELGFFLIFYRGDRVAWGEPGAFKIPSHYTYLKEIMVENGVIAA